MKHKQTPATSSDQLWLYLTHLFKTKKQNKKKTKKPQKKIYTFDAEIQYIAIGCQMGRNFQILTWTACANIATQTISHLRFSTARLLWPNGWSTDSSSPWSRIELPRDKSLDYLTVPLFPSIADCFYDCFFHLLIAFRRLSTCFCLLLMFYF